MLYDIFTRIINIIPIVIVFYRSTKFLLAVRRAICAATMATVCLTHTIISMPNVRPTAENMHVYRRGGDIDNDDNSKADEDNEYNKTKVQRKSISAVAAGGRWLGRELLFLKKRMFVSEAVAKIYIYFDITNTFRTAIWSSVQSSRIAVD